MDGKCTTRKGGQYALFIIYGSEGTERDQSNMRKAQKQEVLAFIDSLHQAHEEIKEALKQKNYCSAQNMLSECQEFAVTLGENIEKMEGEGHITVSFVEEYCETLFRVFQDIANQSVNENKECKVLRKQLLKVENSVKNDIVIRKEVVFFPYKASMWDSLESVYLAAKEDPDCDAYCVPIPYYDLNSDHSFGQMHYEGRDYPENIEIIDWTAYNLEERKPEVIYIHNPYDEWNRVTSVHPRYYSSNLKKYTDTLVYIPYYSTSGGMNEAQSLCPAYLYANYIVIQSLNFRDYFDKNIPDKKFLPFGSPKFDRIINKCKHPSEPPIEWKKKMQKQDGNRLIRRKVYFYNTSITGMLNDTDAFLRKLIYVFDTFKERDDVCIIWRPHPLLESTFDSMRPDHKEKYERIKRYYIENDIGIFDDTPDMADAISWSDAYIGDAGTSVTSLFGIVGKPIFILNNQLHSIPKEDSWRGEIVGSGFNYFERDRFAITQGNRLYISEPYKYDYKYFCDLSEYAYGCYIAVHEINGKRYVCPGNAQDILVLNDTGIEKKVELEKRNNNSNGAFRAAYPYGKYLILLPLKYWALVRYDTETGEIQYIKDNIDIFVKENERNEKVVGGSWIYKGTLYVASPVDNRVFKLDIESGKSEVVELPLNNQGGCISMTERNDSMWMLPYRGQVVLQWNLKTGDITEYKGFPEGFECTHPIYKTVTDEYPIVGWIFRENNIYFAPAWGNMGINLDTKTGIFSEWRLPVSYMEGKEYFDTAGTYTIICSKEDERGSKLFYWPERKLYEIDIEKNECNEIKIMFDMDELREHENGFSDNSQWLKYCCCENAFNSLKDFLDGSIDGNKYDKSKQIRSYEAIAANNDGSCGRKVHKFIIDLLK